MTFVYHLNGNWSEFLFMWMRSRSNCKVYVQYVTSMWHISVIIHQIISMWIYSWGTVVTWREWAQQRLTVETVKELGTYLELLTVNTLKSIPYSIYSCSHTYEYVSHRNIIPCAFSKLAVEPFKKKNHFEVIARSNHIHVLLRRRESGSVSADKQLQSLKQNTYFTSLLKNFWPVGIQL